MINYILKMIIQQKWQVDQMIPSERFFQIKFNLSLAVVNQTLKKMQALNLIYSKQRVGNFVQKKDLWLFFKEEKPLSDMQKHCFEVEYQNQLFSLAELQKIPLTNIEIDWNLFWANKYFFISRYYQIKDQEKEVIKIAYNYNNQIFLPKDKFQNDQSLFTNLLLNKSLPKIQYTFLNYQKQLSKEIRKQLNIPESLGAIIKYTLLISNSNELISVQKLLLNPLNFSSEQQIIL